MKKTISFLCIASLIIIGCHPEPSLAQAQGVVRTGVGKAIRAVQGKFGKKAADITTDNIPLPNQRIINSIPDEYLVKLDLKGWYSNCKNSAKTQVLVLVGRSIISQEDLSQLTEKAVIDTIGTCLRGRQTLKSRIRTLTSELVREILSENHNFQLTSFNRQDI